MYRVSDASNLLEFWFRQPKDGSDDLKPRARAHVPSARLSRYRPPSDQLEDARCPEGSDWTCFQACWANKRCSRNLGGWRTLVHILSYICTFPLLVSPLLSLIYPRFPSVRCFARKRKRPMGEDGKHVPISGCHVIT